MSCGCEWWSSLRESASHGRLWYWIIWGDCNPKCVTPPNKKQTPNVQTYMFSSSKRKKSKMNSYRSMFFSPEAKSAKNCEVLGPLIKQSPNKKITNSHGPKLGENPTKLAPLRLPSHPNARPKVSISTAAVMDETSDVFSICWDTFWGYYSCMQL